MGHGKVAKLAYIVFTEEDVARFEITMDDWVGLGVVEEDESGAYAGGSSHSSFPCEPPPLSTFSEVIFQGAIRQELVDEYLSLWTCSYEGDKILMPDLFEDGNLLIKLSHAWQRLAAVSVIGNLYSNSLLTNFALKNRPITTSSKKNCISVTDYTMNQ